MTNQTLPEPLFTFNRVPVIVKRPFWLAVPTLWGLLTWLAGKRRPQRTPAQRLLVGAAAVPLPFIADIGHALAHTVSARAAGAPMDRILLNLDMPRTLYDNNDVSPTTHRLRALGGPIYSAIGLLTSLLWRRRAASGSLSRELADISTVSHGFIFSGGLLPWRVVDGGVFLKWTLVAYGRSEAEADRAVTRATFLSLALLLPGLLLAARKWLAAKQRHA